MPSVTQVINGAPSLGIHPATQPRGGFLPPSGFTCLPMDDGDDCLGERENVSAGLVGTTVDYLTRFMLGDTARQAFSTCLEGARLLSEVAGDTKQGAEAERLVSSLDRSLSDDVIATALKLSSYDCVLRAGVGLGYGHVPFKDPVFIWPNEAVCDHVRRMVMRDVGFFAGDRRPVADELTFDGGYTRQMSSGDGDYLCSDTLWDLKTNRGRPTSKHTLQIACYWLLGLHSVHGLTYGGVRRIGLANPRRNEQWILDVRSIPDDVLRDIQRDVIGYNTAEVMRFAWARP